MLYEFNDLVEQLQRADFYPHPINSPIALIQTHAAVVFLTGDFAYKIKKSVDFGFLDFSTLEKRKSCLEKELTINASISPDIYLEVLPIYFSANKFSLNNTGPVVEYTLKMHQFPQNCIFSNLLEARKLTELHIKQLAQTVANFHAKSQTNQYINQFGNIENIQYSFIENYQQTKKYINITQTQKQYAETIAFTDEFFNSKEEILKTRQDSQKIRYIHGDLHLNNICFWHDKIQLFDRIEFNDSFCCVDTMYDVAFTMMDLEAKGRQELSNIFLNIYLELTGDWQGVEVLPLYLSRQAYVRAKVNSMALGDSNIDTVQKQKLSESAAAYFQLAWVYSQPKKIFIIIMSGLSGSGKSTVAKYLALGLNAIYIRSDAVRKHLAGISLSQKGDAEIYTTPMNIKTYQQLFTLCKQITASGYSVILDATYNKEHGRQEIIDFAMNNQITYTIIYCDAPIDVIRERLNQRRNDVSDATVELLEHQQLSIDPFTTAEREHLVILDTAGDWQSQLIEKNVFGLS